MSGSGRYIAVVTGLAVALVLHLTVGWVFSPLGAVVAAWWRNRGTGILIGTVVLVLSWLLLIIFNYVVAPETTAEMTRVVSGLVGIGPGIVTVLLTCFVAALLGAAGGGVGGALRHVTST